MSGIFRAGDRVKHASRTDWGLGEVLSDQVGERVQVLFEDVGVKDFNLGVARFVKVVGEEAESSYLTALVRHATQIRTRPANKGREVKALLPFSRAVANFRSYFPGGFQDPGYLSGDKSEREYKLAAHRLMRETLNGDVLGSLIEATRFADVSNRVKAVVNKTNLIHQYEKIWLANGLSSEANQRLFAEGLYALLYASDDFQVRFEKFAEILYRINAAKWPIATYFTFICYPDRYIFLKPQVTKDAAECLGIPINYRPELNWLTYKSVLQLAEALRDKLFSFGLEELKPKDMIDVQSFIWVTAPGYSL